MEVMDWMRSYARSGSTRKNSKEGVRARRGDSLDGRVKSGSSALVPDLAEVPGNRLTSPVLLQLVIPPCTPPQFAGRFT